MARFTVLQRNAALDGMRGAAANYNSATLKVYSGTRPTNADTALSGNTLLATLTMNATAFPASSGGVLTANAITTGVAAATGTAAFVRAMASDGTTALGDFSVGTSAAEAILNTLNIVSGANVSCSALTITLAVGA